MGVIAKPYQKPRPEIVGTVVAPFSRGVVAMGERDFHPLSANFLLPHWLKTHWTNYAEGKRKKGIESDPAEWRVAWQESPARGRRVTPRRERILFWAGEN
jgi:hypothetical protein